jgi:chromosome partitioning protein
MAEIYPLSLEKTLNSIAVFSMKGGTGKTTLTGSLGWVLAEQGHRVLMIDMDPQGHLSQLFDVRPVKGQTKLYYVLIHEQPLGEAVVPTSHPNLSLIPATEDHFYLNSALLSKPWREWKLKDALYALHPFPYDTVIIDLGASLSLSTYVALFAAKILIIPVLPDLLSYLSLKSLFTFLDKTCKYYKYSFDMIWVLMNRVNSHRPLDRENKKALEKYYQRFLMPVVVREDVRFSEAARERVAISTYAPESTGARDMKRVAQFLETMVSQSKSPKPS